MNHNSQLVSVVIPVYNVEKYVEDSIRSIQNQTYTNLEIIVVDDGSSDRTFEIVSTLSKNDSRIKLFKNDKNLKIVKTLNKAISHATGEFILRMDGDDISSLDRVEKKLDFLNKHPEYDLVGCSVKTINDEGNEIGRTAYYSDPKFIEANLKYFPPVLHIWMARKSLYDELNNYRQIPGAEDCDFLLRMQSSGLKFTNIPNYYGYYVRIGRDGNTVSTIGLRQRLLYLYVYSLYLERLRYGKDSFSERSMREFVSTSKSREIAYKISTKFLQHAIIHKYNNNYIRMCVYLVGSLISIDQMGYLYDRTRYRMNLLKFKVGLK